MKSLIATIVIASATLFCTTASAFPFIQTDCNITNTLLNKKHLRTGSFSEIEVKGCIDVEYTQGKECAATIVAGEKDMEYIKVENVKNKLVVRIDIPKVNGRYISHTFAKGTKVIVSSPTINSASISGSADFKATNNIHSDKLTFKIAGSGDFLLKDVKGDDIEVSISGSGDYKANSIDADYTSLHIKGSGDISVPRITSNEASIRVVGSGDAICKNIKTETLKCTIIGSGDISIAGSTRNYTKKVLGSGDIHDSGLKR